MDMDQGSQDGGGGGEIPKNKIINGNGIQKPPILEDSGVTSQAMDVSSPTPLDQKTNNNHKSNIKKVPKQTTAPVDTVNNNNLTNDPNTTIPTTSNTTTAAAAIILPDCCKPNLDILVVGINPGYHSAITKHHYAGPTNHFWKCLHLSGLVSELLSSEQDYRLPIEFGIGLTNLCTRVTTSSSELTGAELRAGARRLMRRLSEWKPKIIAFNGMTAWRAFARHALRLPAAFADTTASIYGRQPNFLDGTVLYAMPSSSARCAHFPTAEDKVTHYHALKQLRDSLGPTGESNKQTENTEIVDEKTSEKQQNNNNNAVIASNQSMPAPSTPNDIFKNMDTFGNTNSTSNSAIAGTNGAQNLGNMRFSWKIVKIYLNCVDFTR